MSMKALDTADIDVNTTSQNIIQDPPQQNSTHKK